MPRQTITYDFLTSQKKAVSDGAPPRIIWDKKTPGFAARVGPRAVSFQYQWRPKNGKARRHSLGHWDGEAAGVHGEAGEIAKLLSIDGARAAARLYIANLTIEGQPAVIEAKHAQQRAKRTAHFKDVWPRYLTSTRTSTGKRKRGAGLANARTRSAIDARVRLHAWAPLADKPVATITAVDIEGVLDGISSPSVQRQLHCHLSNFFVWCRAEKLVTANPAAGLERSGPESVRDGYLAVDELVVLWAAAERFGYPFGYAVQLLILTGCRRNEVFHARWEEFDIAKSVWTLPATRAKNGRAFTIHITPLMHDVLNKIKAMRTCDYLFSTNRRSPVSGFSKYKRQLDETIDGIKPWMLHDLRRSFVTGLSEICKVPDHIAEACANHVTGSVKTTSGPRRTGYNRNDYATERRNALETWSALLSVFVK
ncbi:MAG: site-specific integrase [Chitinophagales bacterium]|nr:site-specific integrase [Hyphomicrobiales bacterium]